MKTIKTFASFFISLYINIKKKEFSTSHFSLNFNVKTFSTIRKNASLYKIDSTIYQILSNTLTSDPINYDTQLKIEKFLIYNYIESFLEKKKSEKDQNIDYNKLNNVLLIELKNNKILLLNLIKFYKENHKYDKDIISKIIFNSSDNYIISILFGRFLKIISNNNRLNKNTNSLDVYLDIGKDLINNYLLYLYKKQKKETNLIISFSQ